MTKKLLLIVAIAFTWIAAPTAHALTVSAEGGWSSVSGDAYTSTKSSGTNYGGALRMSVAPMIEAGAFYKKGSVDLNAGGSTGTQFYGLTVQGNLPALFFVEGRLGMHSFTGNDSSLGYGAGLGYNFLSAGIVKLSAVGAYQSAPYKASGSSTTVSGTNFDINLRLTAGF
jgi:hypothetical protein